MTFEQLEQIKSAVEAFPKTRFVSILEGNKLCIQNTDTDQMFEMEYEECEDGAKKFKKGKALTAKKKKAIMEGTEKIEEFKENCERLRQSIFNVFAEENLDEAVKSLKETIRDLPVVDVNAITEQVEFVEESRKEKVYLPFIAENFGDKLAQYFEAEQEFKKAINMFDENNDLIEGEEIIDRSTMAEILKQIDEAYHKFQDDANVFEKVKQETQEIFEDEELTAKFFENIDFSKNIKVGVTKALVNLKQINEDLDIKSMSGKLVSIFENNMLPIGGAPAPVIYNLAQDNKYTPKFLRFKMGVFTLNDVRTMINEVNEAWSRLGDYDEEDMMFMSDIKMKLEYMYNSQQINDHLLVEIVESFNNRFAKDLQANYDDANKQLAWKDRAQQKVGHKQGVEISSGNNIGE